MVRFVPVALLLLDIAASAVALVRISRTNPRSTAYDLVWYANVLAVRKKVFSWWHGYQLAAADRALYERNEHFIKDIFASTLMCVFAAFLAIGSIRLNLTNTAADDVVYFCLSFIVFSVVLYILIFKVPEHVSRYSWDRSETANRVRSTVQQGGLVPHPQASENGAASDVAENAAVEYTAFSPLFPDWKFARSAPPLAPADRKFFEELDSEVEQDRERLALILQKYEQALAVTAPTPSSTATTPDEVLARALGARKVKP